MKIYRSFDEARAADLGATVATLGVFDGVHVGHRHVIRECVTLSVERALASAVVTFVQHPRAIIAGRAPKLITSIRHRFRLFEELGVAHVLALDFDSRLQEMPASTFAHLVFEDILHARVVVLGHNCRFGRDREGGADFLMAHADDFSFEVKHAEEIRVGTEILSSTAIRRAIERGDLEAASRMLGRPYSLFGRVVHGDGRGRGIGFPTANLDLDHELLPPNGVYGAIARLNGERHLALLNIGCRPTVDPGRTLPVVEAHLLDFEGDLYGKNLEVVFLMRIRDERCFDSLDELVARIERDREELLEYQAGGRGEEKPPPKD